MKVLILYYTKTGHTLEAVNAVAEGIKNAGSGVEIVNVKDFVADKVSGFDALIVGSPCWAGSISKKAGIAGPVKKVLDELKADALNGKKCGGVSVNAGSGGEVTLNNIKEIVMNKGGKEYLPGPVARAGSVLSLWKGPSVSAKDLELYKTYGAKFAK
jgi:multimeric flavodoxin WrbA